MPEKSIPERGKETLQWIQNAQRTNGLGMVDFTQIPDPEATRFLLRRGDVFEPTQGMIKSTVEPENAQNLFSQDAFPEHAPWVWRTPKPKRKGETPEPYEFLAYPDWSVLPSAVAEALRSMGFADVPYLYEGYSYRKMAGGTLRRKMLGSYSKEQLLTVLKLKENPSEAEWTKLESDINNAVRESQSKDKLVPEVQIAPGIIYYPKDGSFSVR